MRALYNINWNLIFAVVMTGLILLILKVFWSIEPSIWFILFVFFISYPYTINGHIASLWGGVSIKKHSSEEQHIYSLCPIFQWARNGNVCGVFSPLCLAQIGKDRALLVIGVSFFQVASKSDTSRSEMAIGVTFVQFSACASDIAVGICLVQHSNKTCFTGFGIVGVQSGKEGAQISWGICLQQVSEMYTYMGIGLAGAQIAEQRAKQDFGIVLYQHAWETTSVINLVQTSPASSTT